MDKVMLARQRMGSYTVNYENKKYKWQGVKGEIVFKREVPEDVFDYLQSATTTFQDGELVILAKDKSQKEEVEEMIENIPDADLYKANTHSKEEIVTLLKGNMKKMESELKKITSVTEKRFVIDIAKELVANNELDSASKRELIIKWHGTKLSVADFFEI